MQNTMQCDAAGRQLITQFEGLVLHWYRDVAGIETGGVGHVRRAGDPDIITPEIADAWLAKDILTVVSCINQRVDAPIGQNMMNALCSLGFNIGCGALTSSSVMKLLNAGDYLAAADAFLLWDRAMVNGKLTVVPALLARRQKEREVFLEDVSTLPTV